MTEKTKQFYKEFFKFFPFFEVPFLFGAILSGIGINRFWGYSVPLIQVIILSILLFLVMAFQSLLQFRMIKTEINRRERKEITGINVPWQDIRQFEFNSSVEIINLNLFFLTFWILLLLIFYLWKVANPVATNILFVLYAVSVYLNSIAIKDPRYAFFFELSCGVQTVLFPFLFAFISMAGKISVAYVIGFGFTSFLIYLAYRFVLAMAVYDKKGSLEPGLFPILIRNQKFWIHHLLVMLSFVCLVVSNRMAVPWRLFRSLLILILPLVAQIFQIERMLSGSKPVWKMTGVLAYANVILIQYFQNITIWFHNL